MSRYRAIHIARLISRLPSLVIGLALSAGAGAQSSLAPHAPVDAQTPPHQQAGAETRSSPFDGENARLDFANALHEAERRSQALQAREAAFTAATEEAVMAASLPDPMLRLSVDNLPVEGPMRFSLDDDFMTMRSIAVEQTFVSQSKRQARHNRLVREAERARVGRDSDLARLRRNTAVAWLDRYFQFQWLDLLRHQKDEAALQVEAADAAFRAGKGAQGALFLARTQVAEIENRIREAEANLQGMTHDLQRWVGAIALRPPGVAPNLNELPDAIRMLERTIDGHPDLALFAAMESQALAEAEVARQEKRLDWTLEVMYSLRGSEFGDMVSIGVAMPLQWNQANRQDRQVTASEAKAAELRAEREEAKREALALLQRKVAVWRGSRDRLRHYETAVLPLANARYRSLLSAYRGGGSVLGEVVEARRMELDQQAERLKLERETALLWAELTYQFADGGTALDDSADLVRNGPDGEDGR